MKYILTWEMGCDSYIEEFDTLKVAETRAKDVLENDIDVESVTISKCVKKYIRKIVEEKLDD